MTASHLLTANAVRLAASRMFEDAAANALQCWTIDIDALPAVADLVAAITRQNYPDLVIPFHSRWRHFDVGGLDRWARLQSIWHGISTREMARRAFDLVIPSVLCDAGFAGQWTYFDAATGKSFNSSEGLALASFELYRNAAAMNPANAWEADWLENLSDFTFTQVFQVSDSNPLVGVAGRVQLLQSLGQACHARPDMFAANGKARPGGLGVPEDQFPLPCLLEGGTWAAGRHLAQSARTDRSSPIKIMTDGTVF